MTLSAADERAADAFFRHVRRRSRVMLSSGVAATVGGILAATALRGEAAGWLGVLVACGLGLILGSVTGTRALRDARRLLLVPAHQMELRTWPYRSVRAVGNNRVLVTLDRLGSLDRTPLAELEASWFTPGSAEAPERSALVFGALARGEMALAIASDGSCFAGRVTRSRA